jgi:hypothetical protein
VGRRLTGGIGVICVVEALDGLCGVALSGDDVGGIA